MNETTGRERDSALEIVRELVTESRRLNGRLVGGCGIRWFLYCCFSFQQRQHAGLDGPQGRDRCSIHCERELNRGRTVLAGDSGIDGRERGGCYVAI